MYQLNSELIDTGFSLTELERMIPWEREIYTALIQQKIEKARETARGNSSPPE